MTLESLRPYFRRNLTCCCLLLALLLSCAAVWTDTARRASAARGESNSSTPPVVAGGGVREIPVAEAASDEARLRESYGRMPLSFEANRGQTDARVKFLSRGNGYSLFLTPDEAVLALRKREGGRRKGGEAAGSSASTLRLKLSGANPKARVNGLDALPGKTNYFVGNDAAKWRTNVATYARVEYESVYPGVNLVYYGNQRQLEYDFIVSPGADAGRIKLSFEGAREVRVDARGELVLRVAGGEIRQRKPFVYQEVAGVRREVAGRYVVRGRRQVGFEVGRYDASLPLVIDPVLVYSTYLGGSSDDIGFGVAVDSSGSAYVTGQAPSLNFPTTPGAFDTTHNGSFDAFVTKLNPAGTALVYSTYLGGSNVDVGRRIAVDSSGSAYVVGSAFSSDFPTTPGAFDTSYNGGGEDTFVSKLDSTGSTLLYSTYLGSPSNDTGTDIAVDSAGSAHVTGYTGSSGFPTTPGVADSLFNGLQDVFITKLNGSGSALVYSTFLGGSGDDFGHGIAIDPAGNAYATGFTRSPNYPTTAGAFDTTLNGVHDAFVTKLNPAGSALVYSTFLGGNADELGQDIEVDSAGNAYATGGTQSLDYPTTPGAFDTTHNGIHDAYVTKLNPSGTALDYSTYLGGAANDFGNGLAVDSAGNAYVTGETASPNFPTTPSGFDTSHNGNRDAFVTKLDPAGASLVNSTYLGGALEDIGRGLAVDSAGSAYVTGSTNSPNFPATPGSFQPVSAGLNDAFVVKIAEVSDGDDDGEPDDTDNCPDTPNPDQTDSDADGLGNACDACPNDAANDADHDGVCGDVDSCPGFPDNVDADGDGVPDGCDACPSDAQNDADNDGACGNVDNCPLAANPGQTDADNDGLGDACDACPLDSANDADGDGVCGNADNCPATPNAGQADADGDGIGDACDPCPNTPGVSCPVPASKDACKNGGWQALFRADGSPFKNQGDCIQYVNNGK